jgi:OOP family OmpA-OmpF porin
MEQRLILPLVCCFAGLGSTAIAAPITLDKTERAAEARRDPGTGICGSITKFTNQPTPLTMIEQATVILNKANGDSEIAGRVSRLFQNMNFSVGPASEADFKAPAFNDDSFPYCQDPNAMPMGNDDNNIAMRIRGYLNVSNTMGSAPQTFVVKCDDACEVRMGKTKQVVLRANDDDPTLTGRRARWITFTDPGLYPVEVIYFQNSTTGYLEWSRANMSIFAMDDTSVDNVQWGLNMGQFKPLSGTDLYSAIVGSNPSCIECGAPNMDCSSGSYCGDGLCQQCNLPDHCGPNCMKCPTDRAICNAGKCVQCTSDEMCPAGGSCDIASGTCLPPAPCTRNDQCPSMQVCRPEGFCGNPPAPCKTDAECLAGQICTCPDYSSSCTQKVCIVPPTMCSSDTECKENYHCDTAANICRLNDRWLYEGGLAGCSMGGNAQKTGGGLGLMALFGLALIGLSSRVRRRAVINGGRLARRAAVMLLPVFFCLGVTDAHAQATSDPISLNAQLFHPALGPENIITVEGTRTPGKWVPMANVLLEYAHKPLRLTDTITKETYPIVPHMVTMHLMGGIGLTRWLAVGVDLPVVVYQAFERQPGTTSDIRMDPKTADVGDLRLIAKFRILDNTDGGFGLGFVPHITFPTGNGEQFRGDNAFGFIPRFAVDYKTKGGFIVALNAGVLLRTADQLARNVRVSHQIQYGLGAFMPLPKGFGIAGELTGGTSFFNNESVYSPLELYVAGRWIHRTGINVNLGGGPGLTPTAGSAQFRLFASVGYLPMEKKKEPVKKQIVDLDPDRDGLIGANDRCPTEWGPAENQGCPDIDTDKDGLIDRLDRCPKEPGPKENQGCPDGDRDGDGLVDRLDSCPDQPGPIENNGCPLLDTDKDGIPDKDDKCPYEPGPKENNGCPPPHKYISVTQEKIELLQKIMFATNKADIKPASFDLLNEVVSVLKSRPSMRVHVEGHTDVRGTLQWNMKLSKMRAESVTKYLIDHGVEAERMTSEGYGPTRPLCTQKTTPCYDKNRRTEFVIVQQ